MVEHEDRSGRCTAGLGQHNLALAVELDGTARIVLHSKLQSNQVVAVWLGRIQRQLCHMFYPSLFLLFGLPEGQSLNKTVPVLAQVTTISMSQMVDKGHVLRFWLGKQMMGPLDELVIVGRKVVLSRVWLQTISEQFMASEILQKSIATRFQGGMIIGHYSQYFTSVVHHSVRLVLLLWPFFSMQTLSPRTYLQVAVQQM